jgi:hypothetical protein
VTCLKDGLPRAASSFPATASQIAPPYLVIVPLMLLPLLKSQGAFVTCAGMACTMLASATLLVIAPRGRAGQPIV